MDGSGFGGGYYSWPEAQNASDSDFTWEAESLLEEQFKDVDEFSRFLAELGHAQSFGFQSHENQPMLPGMEELGVDTGTGTISTILGDPNNEDEAQELKDEIIDEMKLRLSIHILEDLRYTLEERFFEGVSMTFEDYEDLEKGHRIYLDAEQVDRLEDYVDEKETEDYGYGSMDKEELEWHLKRVDPNEFIKDFVEDDVSSDHYSYMMSTAEEVSEFINWSFKDRDPNPGEFMYLNPNDLTDEEKDKITEIVKKYMTRLIFPKKGIETFESFLRRKHASRKTTQN